MRLLKIAGATDFISLTIQQIIKNSSLESTVMTNSTLYRLFQILLTRKRFDLAANNCPAYMATLSYSVLMMLSTQTRGWGKTRRRHFLRWTWSHTKLFDSYNLDTSRLSSQPVPNSSLIWFTEYFFWFIVATWNRWGISVRWTWFILDSE